MRLFTCTFLFTFLALASTAQDVTVDDRGIMRWPDGSEVQGFGVNYTVPFAHAYRSAKRMGVDPKKAIDNDVYHFARLGLDAYRVHVWDTEISDTLGNLIENENLELFDYMLKKMKDRGMKFLITPIAFWGNGWPEPAEDTPGFAHKYGKGDCLTDPDAIAAQEKYLFQFLNHVNPYTGIAYKDDPDIVAFEVSNEPHHGEEPEKVTAYVSKMVTSMRNTGCKKPIFYNVSHSIHLVDAYYDAGIQGGTFQWYPTGLGAQEELNGNLLPNVDKYDITFKDNEGFKKGAKVVYEFDAADVGRSYIYPAMARSFRTAGIQWATHFAYDPTYLAAYNTEYNTHYMNLVYAPQKALSLKISSEVFHKVPVYKDYGAYPANATFDDFRVSYEEDLAEYITDQKFYYTNTTSSTPANAKRLTEVAGFGNSSVVSYQGKGAYFLDKIEKGVWRLEVMPDALWVKNLFGRNSPKKTVAVINWREWPMMVNLSDLGSEFSIEGINEGNTYKSNTTTSDFNISPGTYLLTKKGKTPKVKSGDSWKNVRLNEFFATETTVDDTYVLHTPAVELADSTDYIINATVVTKAKPDSVKVLAFSGFRPVTLLMEQTSAYDYSVTIPAKDVRNGFYRYYIVVYNEGNPISFPQGESGSPTDWDYYDRNPYEVKVVPSDNPLYLFDAYSDIDQLERPWNWGVQLKPKSEAGKGELQIKIEKLLMHEEEKIYDYSMRYHFGKKIKGRADKLSDVNELVLTGRSMQEDPCPLQLSLITKDGNIYGGLVTVDSESGDYRLAISELKPTKLVTLPRPYPGFLPYYFERSSVDQELKITEVETLQISLGPGIPENRLDGKHAVAIESIRFE